MRRLNDPIKMYQFFPRVYKAETLNARKTVGRFQGGNKTPGETVIEISVHVIAQARVKVPLSPSNTRVQRSSSSTVEFNWRGTSQVRGAIKLEPHAVMALLRNVNCNCRHVGATRPNSM